MKSGLLAACLVGVCVAASLTPCACSETSDAVVWEIRRNDSDKARAPVENGQANVRIGDPAVHFPRYLNEIGVSRIRISFPAKGEQRRRISAVWTGGSQGPDRFAVSVDGAACGLSQAIDTARRPYAWYRDEFSCRLGPGTEHFIELSSPEGFRSPIELAGIRMSGTDDGPYQPLCYESAGTLACYEMELGGKGILVSRAHISVFAPQEHAEAARSLADFLERAYAEMKRIYGMDTFFRFSVEHYPPGHKRGWGGISGAGTIGYTTEALERWARLGTTDVRGFAGYTEEMSHGFKAYYRCDGTYEALGVAVQEDIVRALVPKAIADAFWLPEHRQWDDTHAAYLSGARRNPDPARYPWNVLFTRILNSLFLKLRAGYGPNLWPDFFKTLREMDYPLHRAKDTERMATYADVFTRMLGRDMRKEFEAFGIDLHADPPWGWQTRAMQD